MAGCATTQHGQGLDAEEPRLVDLLERLNHANNALRLMAEAGNEVTAAVGGLEIEIDMGPAMRMPEACPSLVRSAARRSFDHSAAPRVLDGRVATQPADHDERMARALILMDAELLINGRGSIGCVPKSARPRLKKK